MSLSKTAKVHILSNTVAELEGKYQDPTTTEAQWENEELTYQCNMTDKFASIQEIEKNKLDQKYWDKMLCQDLVSNDMQWMMWV